jgi:hypothetical protein
MVLREKSSRASGIEDFIEAGGLIAYGPNYADLYRRAAMYVDKILGGASPGDLPVGQPTNFELIINLKTAKALKITVPQTLLSRARRVDPVRNSTVCSGVVICQSRSSHFGPIAVLRSCPPQATSNGEHHDGQWKRCEWTHGVSSHWARQERASRDDTEKLGQ